jgi:hypothetical protein
MFDRLLNRSTDKSDGIRFVDSFEYNKLLGDGTYEIEEFNMQLYTDTPSHDTFSHFYVTPDGEILLMELVIPNIVSTVSREKEDGNYVQTTTSILSKDNILSNDIKQVDAAKIRERKNNRDKSTPSGVETGCYLIESIKREGLKQIDMQKRYNKHNNGSSTGYQVRDIPLVINRYHFQVEINFDSQEEQILPIHKLEQDEQEKVLRGVINQFDNLRFSIKDSTLEALSKSPRNAREKIDSELFNLIFAEYGELLRQEYSSTIVVSDDVDEIAENMISHYRNLELENFVFNESELDLIIRVGLRLSELDFATDCSKEFMNSVFLPVIYEELERHVEFINSEKHKLSDWKLISERDRWRVLKRWIQSNAENIHISEKHLESMILIGISCVGAEGLLIELLTGKGEYYEKESLDSLVRFHNDKLSSWVDSRVEAKETRDRDTTEEMGKLQRAKEEIEHRSDSE